MFNTYLEKGILAAGNDEAEYKSGKVAIELVAKQQGAQDTDKHG